MLYLADRLIVVLTIPFWLPLLLFSAAVTYLSDGRPIFYAQPRMGFDCRRFTIFKIRTMREGPAPSGALFEGWTYANDPRVTRVGAFLRRFRLDELPQLWNVWRGDMSLVGPRPEPFEIAKQLGEVLPDYHERHTVRPGLTGLCQLSSAYRDFGTIEKSAVKLRHDLEYVRTRSLLLNLRIIARTVLVLPRGEGMA